MKPTSYQLSETIYFRKIGASKIREQNCEGAKQNTHYTKSPAEVNRSKPKIKDNKLPVKYQTALPKQNFSQTDYMDDNKSEKLKKSITSGKIDDLIKKQSKNVYCQKLPFKYRKEFPKNLFGIPIEEIDDDYKNVSHIIKFQISFDLKIFFFRHLLLSAKIIRYSDLVQIKPYSASNHSVKLDKSLYFYIHIGILTLSLWLRF